MILGISILRFDATAEIFSPKAMRFSFSSAISDANSLKGFVGSMNFCKAPLILTNVFGGTSLKTIPGLSGSITAFFISPLIDFLYDYIGCNCYLSNNFSTSSLRGTPAFARAGSVTWQSRVVIVSIFWIAALRSQ